MLARVYCDLERGRKGNCSLRFLGLWDRTHIAKDNRCVYRFIVTRLIIGQEAVPAHTRRANRTLSGLSLDAGQGGCLLVSHCCSYFP